MVRNHRAIELLKMGLQAQEVGNCLSLESNSYQEIRLIVTTTTLCVPKSVGSKDNSSINQLHNSQQDRNSEFENTFTRLNRDDTNFNVRIICALLLGNNISSSRGKNSYSCVLGLGFQFGAHTFCVSTSTPKIELNRTNQSQEKM